jgi:hypothetical protein
MPGHIVERYKVCRANVQQSWLNFVPGVLNTAWWHRQELLREPHTERKGVICCNFSGRESTHRCPKCRKTAQVKKHESEGFGGAKTIYCGC